MTFFREEPTVIRYVIRQLIELALIEAVVMLLVTPPEGIAKPVFHPLLGAVIVIIYVMFLRWECSGCRWFLSRRSSPNGSKLSERQNDPADYPFFRCLLFMI